MKQILKKLGIGILSLICCIANLNLIYPTQAQAMNCYDITYIFARGSGESLNDVSYEAWKAENQAALAQLDLGLSYNFYELGSESQFGAQYPAVAVSGSIEAIGNLLGAFVSGGAAFNFGESVTEGSRELLNYIGKVSSACPDTKFVLGGYSQGAMLISSVLGQINSDKVIYVATFGDPKLYLPEGQGNHPVACSGKKLSNYRAYVSDCHAYEGVLGSYRPYQPTGYYNKLGTYCNNQDIMCSSGISITDHTSYTTRGIYQMAARTISNRIRSAFQPQPDDDTDESASMYDLLLVFDVTERMRNKIYDYAAEAKALVQRARSLGGRVAIYTIWQKREIWPTIHPYVSQICDFSCSPGTVDQFIDSLSDRLFSSASTGNLSIYMGLSQAMKKLEWQVGATKTAVVFSSEPPIPTDYDGTTLEDVIELSLAIDPVNVYAVVGEESAVRAFEALAAGTNGKVYLLSDRLSSLADDILGRPTVGLALESYSGVVGDEFVFDASGSELDYSTSGLRYDWDLDADGTFEIEDATATVRQTYLAPLSGYIQVKVTDATGYSSTMSARLDVVDKLESVAEISRLTANRTAEQTFVVDFETNAAQVLVILDDAILGFIDSTTQKTITLSEISQTATLKLVPYSVAGVRGEVASITLNLLADITSADQVPNSKPSEESSTITDVTKLPIKNHSVTIPKAPNTGYFAD